MYLNLSLLPQLIINVWTQLQKLLKNKRDFMNIWSYSSIFYSIIYIIIKGNFDGELLLNGRSVSEDVMIKISGFVAQEDISFVQLTVLEQLKLMVGSFLCIYQTIIIIINNAIENTMKIIYFFRQN